MSPDTRAPEPVMLTFEAAIGRLLVRLTYVSVALLAIGVGLMAASGIGPLDGGPRLDPGTFVADLLALRPDAFLWLGLGLILVTPITRVTAAGVAYARRGQSQMVLVSIGILVVIAIGVVSSLYTEM